MAKHLKRSFDVPEPEGASQGPTKKPKSLSAVDKFNALDAENIVSQGFIPLLQDKGTRRWKHPITQEFHTIHLMSAASLTSVDLEDCLQLVETTSKADYERSSKGWKPRQKRTEMRLPDLRYLLVKSRADPSLCGFVSFMATYEDGKEVMYIYEIHLHQQFRGHGLAGQLMDLVEDCANVALIGKSMLTVFLANEGARAFYAKRGYAEDQYSPQPRTVRGKMIVPDYMILSKSLSGRKKPSSRKSDG